MYPYIDVFGLFDLPLYGPVFLFAFFLAIFLGRKLAYRYEIEKLDVMGCAIYGGIGLLIGSKVMYFMTKLPTILLHFNAFIDYIQRDFIGAVSYAFGGLVFYGGLIGAFLGMLRYCRHFKMQLTPFLDLFAPFIPLVHGFGRIGCFLSGCCYGIEYHGFLAVQFPENELVPELNDVPRFPVQLLEAGLNFIVSGILFYLMKKGKMKSGQLLGIYLLYYTIARYLLELLRGDSIRGKVGVLSTSQIISILLLPVAVFLLSGGLERMKNRKKKAVREA